MIATVALSFLFVPCALGAFSRFTHGRYTQWWYAYQIDRAPDNESTRIVPWMDTAVGALLLYPRTRVFAAFLCVVFQIVGLRMRFDSGKPATKDLSLFAGSLLSFVCLWMGWD